MANKSWTNAQKATVKKLLAKGLSYNRIAKTIQSNNPVRRVVKKTTPKRITKPWTDKEIKKLVAMYQDGCPQKEIASTLGRTVRSIHMKIYNMKYTQNVTNPLGIPEPILQWAKKAGAKIQISFD